MVKNISFAYLNRHSHKKVISLFSCSVLLHVNVDNSKHANTSIERRIDFYSLKQNYFLLAYHFSCKTYIPGLKLLAEERDTNITASAFLCFRPLKAQT